MYYENDSQSNFDELIRYYPKFYRDVYEMVAILQTEGALADDLDASVKQILDNCFVDTADEQTVRRLEKFLYISLNQQRSLDDRKRLIKSYFIGNGKISATMIAEMVGAYTGSSVECRFEPFDAARNNKLNIYADRGTETALFANDILSLLRMKLPAHLAHDLGIRYQYSVVIDHEIAYGLPDIQYCGTYYSGMEDSL